MNRTHLERRLPWRRPGRVVMAAGCSALATLTTVAHAAQPRFWRVETAMEFLAGSLQGLSVEARGRVRLAPATHALATLPAAQVWTLALDGTSDVNAGTGNDGRVYRISGDEARMLFDAPELEVHALAAGRDGRLYVGTSPEGKVYAVDGTGKAEVFFDPPDRYIWALAFDKAGSLLVATGFGGKVYRVGKNGRAEVIVEGPEEHITALVVAEGGQVYAGSAPGGIVYRLDTDTERAMVFALEDTAYREIKAIAAGPDGTIYFAALNGADQPSGSAPALAQAVSTAPLAQATGTEASPPLLFFEEPTSIPGARPLDRPRPDAPRGALLKLLASGEIETLWSSADETPQALLHTPSGLLLSTGDKGRLYRVTGDRTWTMLAAWPAGQPTALVADPAGRVLVGMSSPGGVHYLGSAPASEGVFISAVKDAETVSAWGQLRWRADTPTGTDVRLATRSGNTGTPDDTWSEWSTYYTRSSGEQIVSPRARFLQIKAVLTGRNGATPTLESIEPAFLQRNLQPEVASVTVHPPGEVFQKPLSIHAETQILGLDMPLTHAAAYRPRDAGPPATTFSRKLHRRGLQTFSWSAADPNDDELVFDIEYRPLGQERFRSLRRGLAEPVSVWDTTTVPDGRYVVRVVARDSPSNPERLALRGQRESTPFDVDNTPPRVTAMVTPARRIRAVAHDSASAIRKVEYTVDGGRWREVYPVDGVHDSLEEVCEFTPEAAPAGGSHVVVIRAMDLLGNTSVVHVELR